MSAGVEWPLCAVICKVRPKSEHPRYFEWQHGLLIVVLYAENWESAGEKGGAIVDELPYELVDTKADVRHASALPSSSAAAVRQAKEVGLGLHLYCLPTGDDEKAFEAMDFF
jgi:hypothetical protein